MADKTLPQLDPVTTPVITDILLTRQAADTEDRRYTRAQIFALLSGEHFILPQVDEAATPTLAFGVLARDGLYSNAAGFLSMSLIGVRRWAWGSSVFTSIGDDGAALQNEVASDTNPTLIPRASASNTGFGSVAAGSISAVLADFEGMRWTAGSGSQSGGTLHAPSADLTITAFAGGGQGSATVLKHSYNVITVVASAGDSVQLPGTFAINSLVHIKNDDAAEAADVFPAAGDNLGAGLNTAISLASGASLTFVATVANSTWTQLVPAAAGGGAAELAVEEVTANVTQTQASGTVPTGRLVTVISVNAGDSVTLPSVFAVDEIIELNMPDVDEDTATAAIFPALGDDLGEGVNVAFTMEPHTNVQFRGTVADSTWARLARGASSVFPVGSADGGMVRDVTSEVDEPTLCPRGSQPDDGIGSSNPGQMAVICNRVEGVIYQNNGTGTIRSEPNRGKTITAFATGGQTNAVELLETYNVVTIVGSAGDSVKLPLTFFERAVIWVANADSTESMDLFPALGDDLGQGVNTALAVPAGTAVKFINAGPTTWLQLI